MTRRKLKPRMGRPPIANPKSIRKQLCMTPYVATLLEQAARSVDEPLGVYLVEAGIARAKRETR